MAVRNQEKVLLENHPQLTLMGNDPYLHRAISFPLLYPVTFFTELLDLVGNKRRSLRCYDRRGRTPVEAAIVSGHLELVREIGTRVHNRLDEAARQFFMCPEDVTFYTKIYPWMLNAQGGSTTTESWYVERVTDRLGITREHLDRCLRIFRGPAVAAGEPPGVFPDNGARTVLALRLHEYLLVDFLRARGATEVGMVELFRTNTGALPAGVANMTATRILWFAYQAMLMRSWLPFATLLASYTARRNLGNPADGTSIAPYLQQISEYVPPNRTAPGDALLKVLETRFPGEVIPAIFAAALRRGPGVTSNTTANENNLFKGLAGIIAPPQGEPFPLNLRVALVQNDMDEEGIRAVALTSALLYLPSEMRDGLGKGLAVDIVRSKGFSIIAEGYETADQVCWVVSVVCEALKPDGGGAVATRDLAMERDALSPFFLNILYYYHLPAPESNSPRIALPLHGLRQISSLDKLEADLVPHVMDIGRIEQDHWNHLVDDGQVSVPWTLVQRRWMDPDGLTEGMKDELVSRYPGPLRKLAAMLLTLGPDGDHDNNLFHRLALSTAATTAAPGTTTTSETLIQLLTELLDLGEGSKENATAVRHLLGIRNGSGWTFLYCLVVKGGLPETVITSVGELLATKFASEYFGDTLMALLDQPVTLITHQGILDLDDDSGASTENRLEALMAGLSSFPRREEWERLYSDPDKNDARTGRWRTWWAARPYAEFFSWVGGGPILVDKEHTAVGQGQNLPAAAVALEVHLRQELFKRLVERAKTRNARLMKKLAERGIASRAAKAAVSTFASGASALAGAFSFGFWGAKAPVPNTQNTQKVERATKLVKQEIDQLWAGQQVPHIVPGWENLP